MDKNEHITELLKAWNDGDDSSLERLLPIVESELRRIAHNYMQRENSDHTLQTTALVNEAYLKLVDQNRVSWQNRSHFFAIAAQLMRRILLNHARDRVAQKRGGSCSRVNLEEVSPISPEKSVEIIALDEALGRLAKFDEKKSQIVELRYFGGLTIEEIAGVLDISTQTVSFHWRLARSWLQKEMRDDCLINSAKQIKK